MRSKPASSTSSRASAKRASSRVTSGSPPTSAKSRTRRNSRFEMRGVPRERVEISSAPSSASAIPRMRALRARIFTRSLGG